LLARALAAGDLGRERLEPWPPEAPKLIEPRIHGFERARVDGVDATRAFRTHRGEPALAQDFQLLRDRGLRHPELGGDDLDHLPRAVLPLGEQLQDSPPDRISED